LESVVLTQTLKALTAVAAKQVVEKVGRAMKGILLSG
jgi:hypothetical protein